MQKKLLKNWLDEGEQIGCVSYLHHHGLIKYSPRGDLPLKGGRTSDIYINLRNARSSPLAIEAISKIFARVLGELRPDLFIEVPDSVSCFAGVISVLTGLPYITIRKQEKAGHAGGAKVIGSAREGALAVLFDDAITDGESKILPRFIATQQLGLRVHDLVVLVDRQQGWEEKYHRHGIELNVRAGMTLDRVRYILKHELRVTE